MIGSNNNLLNLRVLDSHSPQDTLLLQTVLETAPHYWLTIWGEHPGSKAAFETFTELPPNKDYSDKFVLGIFLDQKMIGCIDLVKDCHHPGSLMLGLLLISETYQKRGFGKQAYEKILEFTKDWKMQKIRLGVVAVNAQALVFWQSLGFEEIERQPIHEKRVVSEMIVLEKIL